MIRIRIQQEDFSLQQEYDLLRSTRSGAIVTFSGLVRDFDQRPGENVQTLFLQHYPGMTEKLLGDIVDDACQRWPVDDVTVIHRVGELNPGDQIVLVAVSSAHRDAAFQAASFIMDYLKTRATFWKKTATDAGSQWVEMKDSDKDAAGRWTNTPVSAQPRTAAVILAGGQSSRMGGRRKPALRLGDQWLLDLIIARLRPQADQLLLNINEPLQGPDLSGCVLVADVVDGCPGPLTGLASAFAHLATAGNPPDYVLLAPCDGPFFPLDLAEQLKAALLASQADVACAKYADEAQPTFSLWRFSTADAVRAQFFDKGEGGFKGLLKALNTVYVEWPPAMISPFFNINTQEDLELAELMQGLS